MGETQSDFDHLVHQIINGAEPVTHKDFKKLADAKRFTKATILPFMKRLWPDESDKQLQKRFQDLSNDRYKHDIIDHYEKTINQRINEQRTNSQIREIHKTARDYQNEIHNLNSELSRKRSEFSNFKQRVTKERNELLAQLKKLEDDNLILKTKDEQWNKIIHFLPNMQQKKRRTKYESCDESDNDSS